MTKGNTLKLQLGEKGHAIVMGDRKKGKGDMYSSLNELEDL